MRLLSVSAMLLFGNPVAEMRQRLALEALLSRERKALARGVFKNVAVVVHGYDTLMRSTASRCSMQAQRPSRSPRMLTPKPK